MKLEILIHIYYRRIPISSDVCKQQLTILPQNITSYNNTSRNTLQILSNFLHSMHRICLFTLILISHFEIQVCTLADIFCETINSQCAYVCTNAYKIWKHTCTTNIFKYRIVCNILPLHVCPKYIKKYGYYKHSQISCILCT